LPNTGVGLQADTAITFGWAAAGITLAALVLIGAGTLARQRIR
jgi:hypothetical protein